MCVFFVPGENQMRKTPVPGFPRALLSFSHARKRRALWSRLSKLIVLQKTHLRLQNILLPWQLTLFQSIPTWFQYVSDFQLEKRYTRPQTQANIFICLLDHVYQAPFPNMKMERQGWPEMSLTLGRSGTQYVALGIKLLSSNCFSINLLVVSLRLDDFMSSLSNE